MTDVGDRLFNELITSALQRGASYVHLIKTSQIVTAKRVRLKCLSPLCPDYNRGLL